VRWYFLRHAKTEKVSASGKDFDRELAPRGLRQCASLSEYLKNLSIASVVSSSALRTRQTFEFSTSGLAKDTLFIDSLYLADLSEWKSILENHGKHDTLFIGHNEGISEIVSWLTEQEIILPTAALVTVEFLGSDLSHLGPGTALSKGYFRPED
jgi:phosphohistidine phosphatase